MNIAESEKLIHPQSISRAEIESLEMKMNSPGMEVSDSVSPSLYRRTVTVYMFYLNWQTFRQTSIMCNVNILSINYIATSTLILCLREKLFTSEFYIRNQTSEYNNYLHIDTDDNYVFPSCNL